MSRFRIRSGDIDRSGNWRQGSYDEFFEAADFDAAKGEADRALGNNEIKGTESGRYIRIDGLDGSARRPMDRNGTWDATRAEHRGEGLPAYFAKASPIIR